MDHVVQPTLLEISNYLKQGTRNNIVFCQDTIAGIDFLNVGKELSLLLDKTHGEFSGFDSACKQLLSKSKCNDIIGSYLAIENIGFLFEPELTFDFRNMLCSYSQNQCLIIKAEAIIENNFFFFIDKRSNTRVSLEGLSYMQI